MTIDEIDATNRAADANGQHVLEALMRYGKASPPVLERNPRAAHKRIQHYRRAPWGDQQIGPWIDADGAAPGGPDWVSFACFWLDCSREDGARYLQNLLLTAPPLAPGREPVTFSTFRPGQTPRTGRAPHDAA